MNPGLELEYPGCFSFKIINSRQQQRRAFRTPATENSLDTAAVLAATASSRNSHMSNDLDWESFGLTQLELEYDPGERPPPTSPYRHHSIGLTPWFQAPLATPMTTPLPTGPLSRSLPRPQAISGQAHQPPGVPHDRPAHSLSPPTSCPPTAGQALQAHAPAAYPRPPPPRPTTTYPRHVSPMPSPATAAGWAAGPPRHASAPVYSVPAPAPGVPALPFVNATYPPAGQPQYAPMGQQMGFASQSCYSPPGHNLPAAYAPNVSSQQVRSLPFCGDGGMVALLCVWRFASVKGHCF